MCDASRIWYPRPRCVRPRAGQSVSTSPGRFPVPPRSRGRGGGIFAGPAAGGSAPGNRAAPPVLLPLVVGRDRASLALQMTTYTVPAYRRVLDESGFRDEADAILAALADRQRTETARIIEERCLDQLGVAVIGDLAERIRLWSAHADVIGLTVPWYGLDAAAQIALFRDLLQALQRI